MEEWDDGPTKMSLVGPECVLLRANVGSRAGSRNGKTGMNADLGSVFRSVGNRYENYRNECRVSVAVASRPR